MDKKPNVIPTREQINAAAEEKAKIEAYEMEKALVTNSIYSTAVAPEDTPQGHMSAVEMMRQRTENQLHQVQQGYTVQEPSLAEKNSTRVYDEAARQKNEEQMRLRDEQLKKNLENTQNFQRQTEEATNRHIQQQQNQPENMQSNNYQG